MIISSKISDKKIKTIKGGWPKFKSVSLSNKKNDEKMSEINKNNLERVEEILKENNINYDPITLLEMSIVYSQGKIDALREQLSERKK